VEDCSRARHADPLRMPALFSSLRSRFVRQRELDRVVEHQCAVIRRPPVSGRSSTGPSADTSTRSLAVSLQPFAWEALELESVRLGVSEGELAAYAIAYYLADLDSGRVARDLPPSAAH
jgi:hypothetical protein